MRGSRGPLRSRLRFACAGFENSFLLQRVSFSLFHVVESTFGCDFVQIFGRRVGVLLLCVASRLLQSEQLSIDLTEGPQNG